MPEVYVHAIEGRSIEQKRALVRDITDAVVRHFNVKPDAVMVQIMESPKDLKGLLICSAFHASRNETQYIAMEPGSRRVS